MKKALTISIAAITFVWVGMICGISFLEAPLKFQAPGITLELGLGIGELVFGMLTKIEMAFCLLIVAFLSLVQAKTKTWLLFLLPFLIVIIDNAVLMPIMNDRIAIIRSGGPLPESSAHWWYVALELLKLFSLIYAGATFISRRLKIS